jgi:AcrR family transcriptional regulator
MASKIEAERRGRGRPRGFDRAAAVNQAMRLFWERGFEGTSLEDLMDVMELNPSSFYSAFGSKKQLYLEAMDQYFIGPGGYFRAAMSSQSDVRAAIAAAFDRAADACTSDEFPPGCMISLANIYVGPDMHELRDELRHRRNDLEPAFVGYMTEARDRGELPADTDIESLATFFAACMRGMIVLSCDGAPRKKLKAIGRMAMRAWPDA